MSGFVGLLDLRGAPVDGALLGRMTERLAYRGPDGSGSWSAGRVGLGHALLRTTGGEVPQPLTLDGRAWIVADARLDGRRELVEALARAGRPASLEAADAELLLHAWHAWGEGCVGHLLGDFSFAVWDAERERLFAARDPFGIRLFYHARVPGGVVFGNTLEVLRLHPGVSAELDERAVGDFLLFGWNQDPEGTPFAGVRALPPAHTLTVEDGEERVRRWWELPLDGETRYRRVGEYVEHFRELFGRAVEDRVRGGRVGVLMSGGRDSTAVAAFAARSTPDGPPRAYTFVHDRLMPDEERHYSTMAAEALGIPIHHHPADGYRLFERWTEPGLARPQPTDAPLLAMDVDLYREMAATRRVVLTGFGADAALAESRSHLARLLAGGHPWRALREAAAYLYWHRRMPHPGFRTWRRERGGPGVWLSHYPGWLDPGFERRAGLRERWREVQVFPPPVHPLRPEAYARLASPVWARILEHFDPGVSRAPLEFRHPFFDVRVVSFLLSVPPAQWYNDKGILRIALRGVLPEAFLRRQKTPLAGDPIAARLREEPGPWLTRFRLGEAAERFVVREALPRFAGGDSDDGAIEEGWLHLRALSLSLWLERPDP